MNKITRKHILFITVSVLLLLMIFFTRFSIVYVRKNLTSLLFESGTSLSRTVIKGSSELFKLQRLHEENVKERLIYLSSRIESTPTVEMAKNLFLEGYPLVILLDESNNQEYMSPITELHLSEWSELSSEIVASLIDSHNDRYIFGIDPDLPGSDDPGGIAIRKNGKILIVFVEKRSSETHRTGLGYLMRDLAQEQGIEYLVLQNPDGVMIASRGVNKMSSFRNDEALQGVIDRDLSRGRFINYGSRVVYEVISPFPKIGEFWGVLRIGLNLTEYNAVKRALIVPIVIIFVLFFISVLALIYALLLRTKLRISEIVSEGMTNRSGTILFETDSNGIIVEMNREAQHLLNTLGIDEKSDISELISVKNWSFLKRQKSYTLSGYHIKDRVLNFFTESLSCDSSDDLGFIILADDVTELYNLRKRTEELNHLEGLSELTSTIAHDIRNPLNAISIASQKLDIEISDDQVKNKNLLSTINLEINNLNTMIEEFLTLSRPISIQSDRNSLREFIDSLYDTAAVIATHRGISVIKRIDVGDNEYAEFDKAKLSRALGNIVKNAIEASPQKGEVIISISILNNNIEILVSNMGNKIPDEVLNNLFKPVASTKSKGYGLGLFSAYRIIKNHTGDIAVDSSADKTTFRIVIPYYPG